MSDRTHTPTARKPDYNVGAMDIRTDIKNGRIGVAWLNANGTISLILDNFITLTQDGNLRITLFPTERNKGTQS